MPKLPAVILKRDFEDMGLSVTATLPTHNSEPYQKYLESVWVDTLDAFAVAYSLRVDDSAHVQQNETIAQDLPVHAAAK